MDKKGLITGNKNNVSNLAVDGLIYGLMGGVVMYLSLAAFALLSGETPGAYLEHFSAAELASPMQGLLSHLAVSAIYGVFFGGLVWPLLSRILTVRTAGYLGGLAYAAALLFLAQIVVLPGTASPLVQLPIWLWTLGHGVYGLVLGSLFVRKFA